MVRAVEAAGRAPTDADSRLWAAIEGDGLDALFGVLDDGVPRDGGLVAFPLWWTVVVTDATEEVRVYEPEGGGISTHGRRPDPPP